MGFFSVMIFPFGMIGFRATSHTGWSSASQPGNDFQGVNCFKEAKSPHIIIMIVALRATGYSA
jgi:hypothetical protein